VYAQNSGTRPAPRLAGRALAACAALVLLAACSGGGDGPTDLGTTLTITATGRLERGSTVTLAVTANGQPVAAGEYTLSVQPSDAAQLLGDNQVRLLKAGKLTVTASGTRKLGNADITVAAPPVVVFDRFGATNRDLWRVDLDGQNLTQLTTDTGEDQDPTVAQGKVVWLSFRAGNGELYGMPLAGGATTRLTNTALDESTPALSPDGARVAYALVVGGVTKVYTANADGSGAARATPPDFGVDGAIETAPSWAAASKLAFVATVNGSADVFQVTGTGAPALLAGGNAAEVEPAWSLDGTTLAFVSNRGGTTEIYLLNASSGAVTQLTSGAGTKSQPAWTPDGRVVYLETLAGTRLRWVDPAQPADLHTIDTGTGSVGHPAAVAAP
jgi:TolB protein